MGWFLSNLRYVAWTALAVGALFFIWYTLGVRGISFGEGVFWEAGLRWLHVLSGIMWIGLLYYFNFVQTPNAPKIPEEHRGPAIGKVITPAALFWFRWAAMSTLIFGLLLAWNQNYLIQALTLGAADDPSFSASKHIFIGIGMWLAIIMWFNVWFIIWPNQQKALNIGGKFADLAADAKTKAGRIAGLTSRVNTVLSIPMLFSMVSGSHLYHIS
ncbi:MAG TPA: urate hydroxylase PuuD [Alphaproteobacteria bacterium]|nr:urate hydroxylase PuuD [Alphaproteobacteria bacterium]